MPAPHSLALNGASQYLTAPAAVYFTNGGFTIEAWVYAIQVNFNAHLMDFGNGARGELRPAVLPLLVLLLVLL